LQLFAIAPLAGSRLQIHFSEQHVSGNNEAHRL
jgi:hypothetical protein